MTRSSSSRMRTHSPLEAAADGPLAEQVALPAVSSLSSLSTLWIPPDALAQTWGYLAADVPTAPIFIVCALAFQGLASEASALHHYYQAQRTRGRVRHLLHTARELVEACCSWDGVVGWLTSRRQRDLPFSEAVRASLLKEAREQVARLWMLQSQVHTELVQVCLEVGLPLLRPRATPVVPSSLSVSPVPEVVPVGDAAADQQQTTGAQSPAAFTYPPPASTGRILS